MKRNIHLFGLAAISFLFSGCMGYRLGNIPPEGVERTALAPIINDTAEPGIERQVTHALRQKIQSDGRVKLVNDPEKADAVIKVTITQYKLEPVAYDDASSATPKNYRLRIDAVAQLRHIGSDRIFSTSSTYGESTFTFKNDLVSAKRTALPETARKISRFILDDLLEQW